MCSVCRQTPCHPSCPNAPEMKPVHICKQNQCEIYPGDKYLEVDGSYYCEDCLENMDLEEILDLFGYSLETADEDWGYGDDYE